MIMQRERERIVEEIVINCYRHIFLILLYSISMILHQKKVENEGGVIFSLSLFLLQSVRIIGSLIPCLFASRIPSLTHSWNLTACHAPVLSIILLYTTNLKKSLQRYIHIKRTTKAFLPPLIHCPPASLIHNIGSGCSQKWRLML